MPLTLPAGPPQAAGRRWWPSPRSAALVVWIVAVAAAAGAVTFVLLVHRSGLPMPEVYLDNIWPALVLPAVGFVLVGRGPYRMIGWLFILGGLSAGVAAFGFAFAAWAVPRPGLYGWAGAGVWAAKWAWMPAALGASLVVLLLPDGRMRGWRRPVFIAGWAAIGALAVVSALSGSTATDPTTGDTVALPNPLAVPALERLIWPVLIVAWAVLLGALVAGVGYLSWRWRRATGRERTGLAVLTVAAWLLLPWAEVPVVGKWLEILVVPVFAVMVAVGLLRYGDTSVDRVLGRSYLWVSLTTCVVAGYLLVVTVLAAVMQRATGVSLAVAASGVVALLIAPLRTRLQRSVDRLLYGARADPYASVAALSARLEGNVSADEVLPAVARTITDELRLPYAAFHLNGPDGEVAVAEHGMVRGDLIVLPVEYLGAPVGNLVVSTPGRGVALRAAERRLLADLARQSGPAAHGVATLMELRRSRQRLVAAREEERRSLRRELHDDLGAMLTGVALGVDAAGNRVAAGSPAAEQLSRVRIVVSAAVDGLRRIIDGLRPPALDEVGLVAAIRDGLLPLSNGGPHLEVDAESLPALPPEVEVACYHVAVEAVHNAIRHAGARRVTVSLAATDGRLELTVADDGHGIEPAADQGQGLTTMRQRVEEIGGRFDLASGPDGTTVSATLPTGSRP
ncbi:sensor histidine kinase [Krasilnikovia cinnamomea]|nr:ATP-binding protein [Krasilnikovia cinnamomea]